jgi:acyl-coenzyme A synthetase/AMP-(fatty) acid ligase
MSGPTTRVSRPDRSAPPRMASYEEECASFRIDVPERFNPVVDIVERWASEEPEAEALLSVDGQGDVIAAHTASELAFDARRAARALQNLGLKKGDPVFIMLPRVPAWYLAMLSCIRIGAIPMPGPNLLTPRDIEYRIRRGEAAAAIVSTDGAEKIDRIEADLPTLRHRVEWAAGGEARDEWHDFDALCEEAGDEPLPDNPTAADDPHVIFFTSGTVSYPKMVLHIQSYPLGHIRTARFWHDLRAGDRHWTVTDTGWAKAAWGGLFGQWHERACTVQVKLDKPSADAVLSILARHEITSFCAPPTLYRTLVLADLRSHDLPYLRHCTSAGEPLNPEVIRIWQEGTGLTLYDGYGQTETTALVANYRCLPVRAGSMGKPTPGYEVEILDESGRPAADGEPGDVAVRVEPERPVGLFAGYQGDEAATAERFRKGWYLTGDRAARDADGYIWFEGREDDVITSSAYRIGPFEVESALVEHPAAAEAGVVGKPDPQRTEIVCAFVILVPGHKPSQALTRDIQDATKRLTAPYKYPREIHYVSELPKTVSGKIRRAELRDWLRSGIPEGVELPMEGAT